MRVGWKDTSRLSKIEQGRVSKPTRPTLDKIMEALELNDQERNMMLLASGILPFEVEIKQAVEKLKSRMESFKIPIIFIDYSWRVFYFNREAMKLYKISSQGLNYAMRKKPNWLELLFLYKNFFGGLSKEGFSKNEQLSLYEHEIALFKYEQKNHTGEKWYRDLISKLSKSERFRSLWPKIDPKRYEHLMYEYEYHTVEGNWEGYKGALNFDVFSIHPTFDFRFYMMIYEPADGDTYKFYEEYRKSDGALNKG